MMRAGQPDCLMVINGPEDGAEFPIARTPAYIGHEPQCAINLRLDSAIEPCHARITAVSDGYRIRSIGGAPVFVGGKRVGTLISQIVRDGEFIQAGNTLLALECSPDGLASRSRGMASESDMAWFVRQLGDRSASATRWTARFLAGAIREVTYRWKFCTLLALVVTYLAYAPFRRSVNRMAAAAWGFVQSVIP